MHNGLTRAIFLDFSKALDTIENAILIKKISFTTLVMLLLAQLKVTYLIYQFVVNNSAHSSLKLI